MNELIGLRGAIAVALSLNVPSSNSVVILSNTLIVVFFTVLIMGGLTIPMLKWLKVFYKGPQGGDLPDLDFDDIADIRSSKLVQFDKDVMQPFLVREDARDSSSSQQRSRYLPQVSFCFPVF